MDVLCRRIALRTSSGLVSHQLVRSTTSCPVRRLHHNTFRVCPSRLSLQQKVRTFSSMAAAQASLRIELVPCLKDNYAYLLHDSQTGQTAIVDPSEAGPVEKALEARGLKLTHVINTHHHWDHTGGNADLKKKFGATVVGPEPDRDRIPGIDIALKDGEMWKFGEHEMLVFHTPGHTRGHVCYYFPASKAVFTGDTLFVLGCGRTFECTPQEMWSSLSKLSALPDDTKVYCGHEYTEKNAEFALHIDAGNAALKEKMQSIKQLRSQNMPTIPSTIGEEKALNPFLRPQSMELREAVRASPQAPEWEVFGRMRVAKDNY